MNEQIYIDTVRDQIKAGAYEHLISGIYENGINTGGVSAVFLDIGANLGEVSIHFTPYCKRIVDVEPAPKTFLMLQDNVSGFPAIECVNVALSPKDGPVDFYVNDINFTASSTVNTYGTKITVEGKTLATILKDYNLTHIDVAKIDAEGAEGESLSLEQLQNAKDIIKCFYIEFHNCPRTTWEHKLGTTVGNLARCGYENMEIKGMALTARR